MKLARKLKVAVAIIGLAVIIGGFAYSTASAATCIWVCPKPHVCRLICF